MTGGVLFFEDAVVNSSEPARLNILETDKAGMFPSNGSTEQIGGALKQGKTSGQLV